VSTTSTGSSSLRERTEVPPVPGTREEVRRTLASLGLRPTRRRGQSFLVDPFVADAGAALADVRPGASVLEIGGGLGALTAALVRRGADPIHVVEQDPRLARYLRTTFGRRIHVIEGDALEVELPEAACVIGNLPYSVGTPILLRLFARRTPRIVFLVQREVAERLAADAGSKRYGRLSLAAHLYGETELYRTVDPSAFEPVPEVESRLAVHTARSGPLPVTSVATFERVVRTLFSARRKQLGNLLPRLAASRAAAARIAEAAGWPSDWATRRPEDLPPEAFFAITQLVAAGTGG